MAQLLEIHNQNPNKRTIKMVVDCLKAGGLIIYPTDTVYTLGCDINNLEAMEKLARLKGISLKKSKFSIVCNDLSHLSNYTKQIDRSAFKILNRALPGPFTFVMNASKTLPLSFRNHKTVGIRVPDHEVPQSIVSLLGSPIVSTSVHADEADYKDYITDPYKIWEKYHNLVDIVLDSGLGGEDASTVVDLTESIPEIIRQGKGDASILQ